jgi:hypothetical protein
VNKSSTAQCLDGKVILRATRGLGLFRAKLENGCGQPNSDLFNNINVLRIKSCIYNA